MRQPLDFTDPVVVRALAHPLRRAVLTALRSRSASASGLAEEFGESYKLRPVRQPLDITDPVVVRALAHPLRRAVLTALRSRSASASDLAEEFGESLPKLSYHVRQLAAVGLLELVEERPRRGATERFYTAAGRTHVTAEVFETLPEGLKGSLVASWLADTQDQLHRQLEAGNLTDISGRLNRGSFLIDEPSLRRLSKAVDDVYQLALRLEEKSLDKKSTVTAHLVAILSVERTGEREP